MKHATIYIHHSVDELNQALIERWSSIGHQAIRERGSFHVALAGGSTPKQLYKKLAQQPANSFPWQDTHIYFGDERCVAPDHKDSNFLMASQALLEHIPLPEKNIHRMDGGNTDPHLAANNYQHILENNLPSDNNGYHFDLVLLGLGPDGHIASLFPDTDILTISDRLVAAVYIERLASWRLSITYPLLEQARHVLIAVAGSNKTDIIHKVLKEDGDRNYPVQRINCQTEWHIDNLAAHRLQPGTN
jgi:6-phosphogluconolactonase